MFVGLTNPNNISKLYPVMSIILVGGSEREFYFSIQLGISSSQLMNSYFSEG